MMEKLRVFEAIAGYGSQAMALKRANVPFETVAICEWDKYASTAYKANSQLYKMAGNNIVVRCMEKIFEQLIFGDILG